MDNTNYAQRILEDLVEFTGKPKELVAERCKVAAVELAWEWDKRRNTLQYYRDTDLYIFDLTFYQAMLVQDLNFMLESAKEKEIKKILDFGGGIGEYTIRAIKELGAEVTYLEIADSQTLEYAKWRFKKHGVEPKIVDEKYPWQKEKWDAIFAMDVLEHLEDPEPTIKAFEETAKYIFSNPNAIQFNWLYPQHISKFVLANFTEKGLNLYQNNKSA